MMYIRWASAGGFSGRSVPGRSFWRKTNGVVKEKRGKEEEEAFHEKSWELDPSRIFFMESRGVSAARSVADEEASCTHARAPQHDGPHSRAKGL